MRRTVYRCFTAVVTVLFFVLIQTAWGQEKWTWKDRGLKTRTRAELDSILAEHRLLVESNGVHGRRADLSCTDLREAKLAGAELTGADLHSANLRSIDLTEAHLSGANLYDATLIGARLEDAQLNEANLKDARLIDAELSDAHLVQANLTNTDLTRAELSGTYLNSAELRGAILAFADLTKTHLDGASFNGAQAQAADFEEANLRGAVFEPTSIPDNGGIASAENLEYLKYDHNSNALAQLRKQFLDGGFRDQERKITYALNRRQAELDGQVERWSKTIAFDWTCQYGMNPGHALKIWLYVLVGCWAFYAVVIHLPVYSGIYRVQKSGLPGKEEFEEQQVRAGSISTIPAGTSSWARVGREVALIYWAGLFSLLTATTLGFRDLNLGLWLRLLPRREYELRPKGWVRTVAGFQSVFSMYLFALWVLTYFGRPFE